MPADRIVHIIDDDPAARESLAFLLETADFAPVVYDSATQFLAAGEATKAGCIVTDVRMPGMSGIELVQELNQRGSGWPVVVITGHGDVPLAVDAMRSGAVDFIEKPFTDTVILDALAKAFARLDDQRAADGAREAERQKLATLSPRERDVMRGLVAGQANKTIAIDLGISHRTVEVYRANLMSKLGASSLSDLVRMALTAGDV